MTDFVDAIRLYVDPVAASCEMQCIYFDKKMVRYENMSAFLELWFDEGRSFEISVFIGEKSDPIGGGGRTFDLSELLSLKGVLDPFYVEGLQVADRTKLVEAARRLSVLIETFAGGLLRGGVGCFDELHAWREKRVLEYAHVRDVRRARARADEAWRKGDYEAVVRAYRLMPSDLTKLESRRLAYSERAVMNSKV